MRKSVCFELGSAIILSAAGLAACGNEEVARNSYIIVAQYAPDARTLTAEMQFTFSNSTENALDALKFELWANAYREGAKCSPVSELAAPAAYYNGKSYGGMEILSVTGGESFSVGGEDENILTVPLSAPLYPNESVTLTVCYTVTLAEVNHRLGVGENAVNLANYYPALCYLGENGFEEHVYSSNGDPFVSECADYDVTLTVPETYTAVYGGKGEEVAENGNKTYHVVAENVRDSAFVLGENFERLQSTACGVEVSYYYFADESPELALAVATDSLTYFAETFGDYAYPCYTVVETDFPFGGMEYTGLSMISSALTAKEIPVVVAHETAHQWWYAMVGSDQFNCAWQDEGLAEFSTALFLEAYPAYGGSYRGTVNDSVDAYRAYYAIYSQLGGGADTSMNRALTEYTGDYEYRILAYDKGVVLFDSVKDSIGERKFFSALRSYFKEYNGSVASYEDLLSCFEGTGAEAVFESFVKGLCVI